MERILTKLGILGWLRKHCRHEWENTGSQYTDPELGFTVNLMQCRRCGESAIVQV